MRITEMLHEGFVPVRTAWTTFQSPKPNKQTGIIEVSSDGSAFWAPRSVIEDRWKFKPVSFDQWISELQRIEKGEFPRLVAMQDTLIGAALRSVLQLYSPPTGVFAVLHLGKKSEGIRFDLQEPMPSTTSGFLWTDKFETWMRKAPQAYDQMQLSLLDGNQLMAMSNMSGVRELVLTMRASENGYRAEIKLTVNWLPFEDVMETLNTQLEIDDPDLWEQLIEYGAEIYPEGSGPENNDQIYTTSTKAKTWIDLRGNIDSIVKNLILKDDEKSSSFVRKIFKRAGVKMP